MNQFNFTNIRSDWQEKGYILLKNAIQSSDVIKYLGAVDEVIKKQEPKIQDKFSDGSYTIVKAIEHTNALDELIDYPTTFPVILELMGSYLQIMGTQIYVRPPNMQSEFDWHTDAGPSLQRIRVTEDSLALNFKIQFFLTDIKKKNLANFCLVPGSHNISFPESGFSRGKDHAGAIQLCVNAGDAVIFPHNLWHSVAPNQGDSVRRSVTFRYGQMWCRPYDYEKLPQKILRRLNLRRSRLMGYLGTDYTATDYYKPHDQLEIISENKIT